jgi:hypothetical protein
MAQNEDEKVKAAEQASLFDELETNDVKVAGDAANQMKENIMKAGTGEPWLGIGVHDVKITAVELTKSSKGNLGINFIVGNEDGKNEVTMYLSEAALPYTIENITRIAVHNMPEDKKTPLREAMANIVSAKDIFGVAKEKFVGYQCWLSVREGDDEYTNKNGEVKKSLKRNLLSYKPKETDTQAAVKSTGGGTAVPASTIPDLPF